MNCAECGNEITPETRVDIEEFKNLCHPCYKLKPKHVCVDFDGVLAEYTGWKGPENLGRPRAGAREFLEEIGHLGMKVIILTTRDPLNVDEWLRRYGLYHLVDRVTQQKPPALTYIDDRAICFQGDFGAVLWKLVRFTPYWKNGPG
jgi:adenylylsulfate kinase